MNSSRAVKRVILILLAAALVLATAPADLAFAQRMKGAQGGGHSGGDHGGGGHRGGGNIAGGIMLGIGVLSAIQDANRQSRAEPRKTRRKPVKKKAAVRKPAKRVVRRTPPRQSARVSPPVVLPEFRANEILVRLDDSQPDSVADEIASRHRLIRLDTLRLGLLGGRLQKYRIDDNRTVQQVAAAVAADGAAGSVQFNYLYRLNGSAGKTATSQYALSKLAVGPAHEIATGSNIRVAVIDTGVDRSHPALRGSIEKTFNAVDDGKAAIHPHGTAIAGLIAGHGDKVQGIAPMARILAIRAFYRNPQHGVPETTSMMLLRAFDWAIENDAKIFNMSFAGPADPLVREALKVAHERGVIEVAAAGNGGEKAPPAYPAAYDNVIATTALDYKDRLYKDANHGTYLTVAAPGVDILVPAPMKRYSYSTGTSFAAAQVSGLVALLLERRPQATAQTITDVITATAHDLGPKGRDPLYGAGRADALASLTMISAN